MVDSSNPVYDFFWKAKTYQEFLESISGTKRLHDLFVSTHTKTGELNNAKKPAVGFYLKRMPKNDKIKLLEQVLVLEGHDNFVESKNDNIKKLFELFEYESWGDWSFNIDKISTKDVSLKEIFSDYMTHKYGRYNRESNETYMSHIYYLFSPGNLSRYNKSLSEIIFDYLKFARINFPLNEDNTLDMKRIPKNMYAVVENLYEIAKKNGNEVRNSMSLENVDECVKNEIIACLFDGNIEGEIVPVQPDIGNGGEFLFSTDTHHYLISYYTS
jgi:hypothetical protein